MLIYVVERVYDDPRHPRSVMSVWSSLDRARAWAERPRHVAPGTHLAIRATTVEVSAAAS
jgi:hypothetical protein